MVAETEAAVTGAVNVFVRYAWVIPLLPLYAETFKPSPLTLGFLMASFSAMQFVFAPILGRF